VHTFFFTDVPPFSFDQNKGFIHPFRLQNQQSTNILFYTFPVIGKVIPSYYAGSLPPFPFSKDQNAALPPSPLLPSTDRTLKGIVSDEMKRQTALQIG
jgi:hypothetical protein